MAETGFSYAQLSILNRIAKHVASATEIHEATKRVLEWLAEECSMRRGVVTLMASSGEELKAMIAVGEIAGHQADLMRYKPGEGITGEVFATGEPV